MHCQVVDVGLPTHPDETFVIKYIFRKVEKESKMTKQGASEPAKMPLPSGPSTLCFNKDEFMKEEFIVDRFVMECRRRVPLETLRDDLVSYMKTLQTAMIELINKDYADFVNLSTNLVGMDKAINHLTDPLEQLKEEIKTVHSAMKEAITAVEEKLKLKARIREKKANLQRLMNIIQSVEKIEKLLGIQGMNADITPTHSSELSGQLIERVATEFNKLQFYVNKSRGLPLVEQIKPRIANITTTLQYSLEGSFIEGLEKGQVDVLRQCLRTYAIIDKMKDAENLFRQHIVRSYMENVISEEFLQGHPSGLQAMYAAILDFIPRYCKKLKEVTSSGLQSGGEVVRGYDFLVNAVWPEVIANIEARTPSIFAPGNPDIFHQKYSVSMVFLDQFERQCGSQASVKRLRAHPSYHTFMSKWSLPVYFQIRFQEIAGSFESSLNTPFNNAQDKTTFHLHGSHTLWLCLRRCWQDGVFLNPLCHRFWKLNLQLLSRYGTWIEQVAQDELSSNPGNSEPEQINKPEAGEPNQQEVNTSPPITTGQIVCLIVDAETVANQIPTLYEDLIRKRVTSVGCTDPQSLLDALGEMREYITKPLPSFHTYIITEIYNQCSVHLRLVNDIPRLFRKTNRDIPSKPSQYVSNLVKPLQMFIEEHKETLTSQQQCMWVVKVLSRLGEQYYSITSDVLTSVKKMEDSLKRLKRARGSSTNLAAQGMSDDDKIRLQLSLDVHFFGEEIESLGAKSADVEVYLRLRELVESARNASSTSDTTTHNGNVLTVP